VNQPTAQWYKEREPKSESDAEQRQQRTRRKDRIVPQFTDAQIEKMIRESDEGKTAREIMREYGFKSTSDWYQLKARHKKKQLSLAHLKPQEFDDADDEEEPEDEPVVERPTENVRVSKRYDYQCSCGYSFKSTIPPQLIKCPDCMGKPKIVEEVGGEE
jgi:hypothetical protein